MHPQALLCDTVRQCQVTTPPPETPMPDQSFEEFKTNALSQGFDVVLERQWAPGTVVDTHTHDFAVSTQVAQGEIWLTIGDDTRHLLPGDTFTLDRAVPHAERYGAEGATFWVARRNT